MGNSKQRIVNQDRAIEQLRRLEAGACIQNLRRNITLVSSHFVLFKFTLTSIVVFFRSTQASLCWVLFRKAQASFCRAARLAAPPSSHSASSSHRLCPPLSASPLLFCLHTSSLFSELSPAPSSLLFTALSPTCLSSHRPLVILGLCIYPPPNLPSVPVAEEVGSTVFFDSVSKPCLQVRSINNVLIFPAHRTSSSYRLLLPSMARSEDCLHCADLQAELEEIRTQQSLLEEKQGLLDARLEEHDRRLDEHSRRLFEQDRINTEKYKAEIQLFMHRVTSLQEQFRQLTNRCGHVEESLSTLKFWLEKNAIATSSSSVNHGAKDDKPEESTARHIQHIMID